MQNPVHVSCGARTPEDVLSEVRRAVARGPRAKGTFVVLEDLDLVKGSVSKCLADLVRLATDSGAHLVIADPSGLTQAFLEGIGGADPFVRVG